MRTLRDLIIHHFDFQSEVEIIWAFLIPLEQWCPSLLEIFAFSLPDTRARSHPIDPRKESPLTQYGLSVHFWTFGLLMDFRLLDTALLHIRTISRKRPCCCTRTYRQRRFETSNYRLKNFRTQKYSARTSGGINEKPSHFIVVFSGVGIERFCPST
jgi:hypothetical protein